MAAGRQYKNRACTGKVEYASRREAGTVAKKMGGGCVPYYCPFCGSWHVGRNGRIWDRRRIKLARQIALRKAHKYQPHTEVNE